MNMNELRIELLKLTYAHGRTSEEAVERAKTLEKYVLEEAKAARPTLGLPGKSDKG